MVLVSWILFNFNRQNHGFCLKAAEPLPGGSTTKSLGVPGAHLIDFGKMKS